MLAHQQVRNLILMWPGVPDNNHSLQLTSFSFQLNCERDVSQSESVIKGSLLRKCWVYYMLFVGTKTNQILSRLALEFTLNSILFVFTNLHRFLACLSCGVFAFICITLAYCFNRRNWECKWVRIVLGTVTVNQERREFYWHTVPRYCTNSTASTPTCIHKCHYFIYRQIWTIHKYYQHIPIFGMFLLVLWSCS